MKELSWWSSGSRLRASNAEGIGLIPSWGNNYMLCGAAKK